MSDVGHEALRITLLTAADTAPYRELMLQAYELAADAFTSTAQERAMEPDSWWAKRIADPQGRSVAFGAFEATELVGTVALEFSGKPKTRLGSGQGPASGRDRMRPGTTRNAGHEPHGDGRQPACDGLV
jgi:hypothetical protein